jgi:hypothetical protein
MRMNIQGQGQVMKSGQIQPYIFGLVRPIGIIQLRFLGDRVSLLLEIKIEHLRNKWDT